MTNRPFRAVLLVAGASGLVLAGPAVPTSRAGAQGTVATISASDKAEGAKANPQLLAEFATRAATSPSRCSTRR